MANNKNCTYSLIINGKEEKGLSYISLYSRLRNDPGEIKDLIFSKDNNLVVEKVSDKIDLLIRQDRNNGLFTTTFELNPDENSYLNGAAEVTTRRSEMTVSELFDSRVYSDEDGTPYIFPHNIEEHINRLRDIYKNELQNLSEEDREKEISKRLEIIRSSRQQIKQDCSHFHRLMMYFGFIPVKNQSKVAELTENIESFNNVRRLIIPVSNDIESQIRKTHRKKSIEFGNDEGVEIKKNINITIDLPVSVNDKDKLRLHIDYLVINADGSVEIFNIKGSHESHNFWDNAKKERYQEEFGLILKALQQKGINVNNAKCHIIPAVLQYDELFSRISNISIEKPICYSHYRNGFILYNQLARASKFIKISDSKIECDFPLLDSVLTQLDTIFPQTGLKAQCVKQTIESYIDDNWKYWKSSSLQPDKGWRLNINGVIYEIADEREGSENQELVEELKAAVDTLSDFEEGDFSVNSIISDFKKFRRDGRPRFDTIHLNSVLHKYFEIERKVDDGEKEKLIYRWSLIENEELAKAGIMLFKDDLGFIDIISLTSSNLNKKIDINGRNNILGCHLADSQAKDNQGRKLMDATSGNLEIMRVLFLLNELTPNLETGSKLGNILIIGGIGTEIHSKLYEPSLILPNFTKALEIHNKKEPNKIKNNLATLETIDPIQSVIVEYENILRENENLPQFKELGDAILGKTEHFTVDGNRVESLATAETIESKISQLESLLKKLGDYIKTRGISLNENDLIRGSKLKNSDATLAAYCRLFIETSISLNKITGNLRIAQSDLSTLEKNLARPLNISNPLVAIVSKLMSDAIHTMSDKLEPRVNDFNKACQEYYEAKGYGKLRNWVIGDLSSVFKHLFKNEDDLIFKNPYDPREDLDEADRKFLKIVLYEINKVRYKNNSEFPSSNNDSKILTFIENVDNYFLVPLKEASLSTKWTNPGLMFKNFARRVSNYVKNPGLFFREMYESILTNTEEEILNEDIKNLQANNRFLVSDIKKVRTEMIGTYGKNYFETNLQNLVIDYAFSDILQQEMNHMLMKARGTLLWLKLSGIKEGKEDKYDDVVDHINKYLKVSVFNKSIVNKDVKPILTVLQPLRKAVSSMYIALNPVAAIRDSFGGFISNIVRTATKFRTNVDAKDVLWAYKFVLGLGTNSTMDIDLMDKLNSKYLISNINIEQLQEGYKTNREGITNIGNIAYWTLRKPDYLNRMVLFVSRLKHDGSINAYSVDDDGRLKYNWRLDKRFDLLASDNKTDIDAYNKQKALYLSLIRQFNEENPELKLAVKFGETDLPDGYTQSQIEEIKHLSDSIYGSYNRSTKSMYEYLAIGSQFGIFSTWMNGIYDVYFGSLRESAYETELIHAEDELGNKLYIDEDGNITTQVTNLPYIKNVPILVQGVCQTLIDAAKALKHGRFNEDIWQDSMQRRNLNRAFTDLIMSLIMYMLFKLALDPAYKDYKKQADGEKIVQNMMVELLYKGTSSSWEEFKGPLPIFDYVMNSTSPASIKWGVNTLGSIADVTFGDKTLGETLMKAQALPRAFHDTYKLYIRDTKAIE